MTNLLYNADGLQWSCSYLQLMFIFCISGLYQVHEVRVIKIFLFETGMEGFHVHCFPAWIQ